MRYTVGMTMNGEVPPQTIPNKQTEEDKVVVPPERLVELRENRDNAQANAATLSALQILEEQNPELKALMGEIRLKERALNEAKDDYAYYLNEHEDGISLEHSSMFQNMIKRGEEELEKLKTAKQELIKRLQEGKGE